MRSIRYYLQNREVLKAHILDFFILSVSNVLILIGIAMILYCSIFIDLPIRAFHPYILYGLLITMGIFGIRFYQLEGSFNVSSDLPSKTGPKAFHKSDQKGFAFFEKPVREKSPLESLKELKIPKMNMYDVSISNVKDPKLSGFDILSIPEIEEGILSKDKTLYDYLNKTVNQTIKEIQDIIQFSNIPKSKLLFHKDDAFRSGLLFEQKRDYYSAIANYSIAREIAKDLELDEEIQLLNQSIKRLLQQFSSVEGTRLMKKYHLV